MKFYRNHIQIFLSSFNFLSKGIIICLFYCNKNNDHFDEIIRLIVYEFVSKIIFIFTKLEADPKINIIYCLLNIVIIIFSEI